MNGLQTLQQLSFGHRFRIPDYQRSYSWGPRQWQDLLDDLDALRTDRNHFTGTVVLHSVNTSEVITDQAGLEYEIVDVVDGQQRLATLTLLLDAIRRDLRDEGLDRLADGIGQNYVWILNRDGLRIPRIVFPDDMAAFFDTEIVQDKAGASAPKSSAQQRLLDGSHYFSDHLAGVRGQTGGAYRDWLEGLHQKVTNRLLFTTYQVGPDDQVGMIFEALNDRGLVLAEMDKVKNYVMYLAEQMDIGSDTESALKLQVTRAWTEIFTNLKRATLEDRVYEDRLLRSQWLMAYESASQRRTSSVSRAVKQRFSLRAYHGRDSELRDLVSEYISLLGRASAPYCDVLRPDWDGAFARFADRTEARRWALCLQRCGPTAPFLPLLMAQRVNAPDDVAGYVDLTRACELYSFRTWKLRPGSRQVGRTHLQRLGLQLFRGELSVAQAVRHVLGLSLAYLPDHQFRASFERDEDNDWYNGWDGLKYFLYEWERHLSGKASPEVTWDEIISAGRLSIEHILPQSPREGDWMEFTSADRQNLTDDLGNLCLTRDNSIYSNKSYRHKRGWEGADFVCYMYGSTADERDVARRAETWDVERLLARRGRMVAWAIGRWSIDRSSLGEEAVAITDPYDEQEVSEEEDVDLAEVMP